MRHHPRLRRRVPAPLAACALLLAACNGGVDPASGPEPALPVTLGACGAPHTPIPAIQGPGTASPLDGRAVVTEGVVVGDFEGRSPALRGFYLQDPVGDGDPATSDALFVFNGDADLVSVGDVVRVAGIVGEYREQTQISATSSRACGQGSVAATELTLPLADAGALERFEGMRVRYPQTLFVTETYQLGRYGEVVLASSGRLPQPTNVAAPGAPAAAVQAANERNRIVLDDASLAQNPDPIPFGRGGEPLTAANTLRGGDSVAGLTGVLTQTPAAGDGGGVAYRLRTAVPPAFAAANPRREDPPAVGGTLRVASFNVLNYFDTFDGCTYGVGGAITDCRGAESQVEFERQWPKTVAALAALDADVVGVIEVENDGYGGGSAIAHLVGRLNDATAPGRWAFIDADTRTGQPNALGTDAIKVGLLYRTDRATPVGRTAALATRAFTHGGESGPRTRPALAQAFAGPGGGRLTVVVNHLKSKGSPCEVPDAGDGQGNCNAARTAAARELARWLATDPTASGDPDVLVLGDMNAYAMEDPIRVLLDAGYVDLIARHVGRAEGYSYVFGGQWGYLDHALASPTLAPQVTGAAEWHINADEPPVLDYNTNFRSPGQVQRLYAPGPYRSADHDPVVVGLRLSVGEG